MASAGILAIAAAGVGLQVMDDAAGRLGFSRYAVLVAFAAGAAAVVAVAALAARRAGSPVWQTVLAAVLVAGAWVAAMWLFDASPLRRTVGYIYGNETPEQLAYNLFAMRLFLCWATTTIVAGASVLLSRRGADLLWVGICFVLGLCSAVLWGGYLLAGHAAWLRVAKWPKLMSSVMLLLLLVALVRLLAGAMRNVGRRATRA